jgi:hypothetical protein
MNNTDGRFTCVREPGGTWAVTDNETHEPASLAGKPLIGREQTDAEAACLILSRIYETGLDKKPFEGRRG